jgi:hypothetical protein
VDLLSGGGGSLGFPKNHCRLGLGLYAGFVPSDPARGRTWLLKLLTVAGLVSGMEMLNLPASSTAIP